MLETFDTVLGFAAVMLTLSLFVTACVQLASAACRLRRGSLVWGLQQMFEQLQLDRSLAARLARQVVDDVPVLKSGSRWLFGEGAQAITAAELTKVLRGIAAGRFTEGCQPDPKVLDWLAGLGAGDRADARTLADDSLVTRLPQVAAELAKLFPAQAEAAREAVQRAVHRGDALAARVDSWFDSAMARAADRFTLLTRYWTVAFSAALVLGLQIDAQHIYKTLRADDALRHQWLARIDPLLAQAEKTWQDRPCGSPAALALEALLQQMRTEPAPDAAAIGAIDGLLQAAAPRPADAPAGLHLLAQAGQSARADAFGTLYDHAARACFGEALAAVKKQSEAMQDDRPLIRNSDAWKNVEGRLGMLMAAVLLSLGAPFWFNLLKQLASLRPVIAARAGKPGSGDGARAAS